MSKRKINTALISVFEKQGLEPILALLNELGIKIISTGGTKKFIEEQGYKVTAVEELTGYPSIFGGRVKTLHPVIFGGILMRDIDVEEAKEYNIPSIDLIIVNLYPFEQTVSSGASHQDIIEKIDIGGVSLIRAAAKNYERTLIISHKDQYNELIKILQEGQGYTTLEERERFAEEAFMYTSHYDIKIYEYFNKEPLRALKISENRGYDLRYGENPHQQARFFGNLGEIFTQVHGKQLSYNNLLDIDSAIHLIAEFEEPTIAIIKHTNPCGLATDAELSAAWDKALAGDPESAFGGIIVANKEIDKATAEKINKLFFEIIIAPSYHDLALDILKQKKNRRILILKHYPDNRFIVRSAINGYLYQEKDIKIETNQDINYVTERKPDQRELEDMLFANKIVKHLKSNAIALVKNKQLVGGGMGQTSRVDALRQAIVKAKRFGLELEGAVMASDAFFPFADSVEIAYKEGIRAVIQPGGSIRDQDSIDFCNSHDIVMAFTGIRHFKH